MIDLHTHTRESDGEKTIEELIDLAISKNIKVLAITNHDTAEGLEVASNYAKDKNIIFIPGIELDAKVDKGQMHILGLCIDSQQKEFNEILQNIKKERVDRNNKFIEELNKMGFDITLEELREVSNGNIIAKPHFAQIFIRKRYINTTEEMFDKYFNQPPLDKIKKTILTPEEVIKLIKKSNGIAVLAHPQSLKLSDDELVEKIKELKTYGLDGLECYHSGQTPEQMKKFKQIAKELNLLITKGSDYHGPIVKPKVQLGEGIDNNIISQDDKTIIDNLLNYRKTIKKY